MVWFDCFSKIIKPHQNVQCQNPSSSHPHPLAPNMPMVFLSLTLSLASCYGQRPNTTPTSGRHHRHYHQFIFKLTVSLDGCWSSIVLVLSIGNREVLWCFEIITYRYFVDSLFIPSIPSAGWKLDIFYLTVIKGFLGLLFFNNFKSAPLHINIIYLYLKYFNKSFWIINLDLKVDQITCK